MINLDNVSKKFGTGQFALSDISFEVDKGEFVFLAGSTGSGKTTIFRLLIREMLPSKGTVVVNSWDLTKLPQSKVPELRKKIGVIFQDLKLLADRTVFENIALPLELVGISQKEAKRRTEEVLEKVGITEHKDKFPIQLSGGERQRAAIARALILDPEILLADEPTGDLDEDTSWEIVKLLTAINDTGTTIIMATHNKDIIKKLNKRVIELEKGELLDDKHKEKKHKHEEEKKEDPEVEVDSKKEENDKDKEPEKPEKKEEKEEGEKKESELENDDIAKALEEKAE